jgi:glycosyltransferase involved in cell wall biosynthesis
MIAIPRVSIITPVYNASRWLKRPVESVLAQTHREFELIAIDDGSKDDSVEQFQTCARQDSRVRLLRQPVNGGVAAARNAGLDAATGDYIAFLDADDWWHPRKLELQLATMQRTGAKVSYAGYQRVGEDGRPLSHVNPPARVTHRDMLASNFIGHLTGMYDRSLGEVRFQRIGHEDYVFWLELVRRAGIAVRVDHDEPLAFYLVRDGSVSANKLRTARWQWNIYRNVEKLGLAQSAWYMTRYVWNALAKRA